MERSQRTLGTAVGSACLIGAVTLLYLSLTRYDSGWPRAVCAVVGTAYGFLGVLEAWRVASGVPWEAAGQQTTVVRLRRTLTWILLLPLAMLKVAVSRVTRRLARWSIGASMSGDRIRDLTYETDTERIWVFTDQAVYVGGMSSGFWRVPYAQMERRSVERVDPWGRLRVTIELSAGQRQPVVSGVFSRDAWTRVERILNSGSVP